DRRPVGRGRGHRLHQGGLTHAARDADAAVRRDADEAAHVRGLQTQVPLHVPRDAAPAEGAAVGAQHGRRDRPRGARRLLRPLARRTSDEVVAKMRSSWRSEGFRDEQQSLDWRDRSTEMVIAYLRDTDPYYEPRGVERTVAFTTERASLRGRVDRIDERPAR